MRLASIVLPSCDNDGAPLDDVHASLKRRLCEAFGGYTRRATEGGWIGPDGRLYEEPGFAYDVAVEPTPDNCNLIRAIAIAYAAMARQLAVFVMFPDGEAEIISIPDQARIAA